MKNLPKSNPPPYIHCSKINSFLADITVVADGGAKSSFPYQKRVVSCISNIVQLLDQFQQLHAQCSKEICAQFCLTTSLQSVYEEIFETRKEISKNLEIIGLHESSVLIMPKNEDMLYQNKVDLRRISIILNQLESKKDLARRPDVMRHLSARRKSLESCGEMGNFDQDQEVISIPDIPPSLNLIVHHDDIQFGALIGQGISGSVYKAVLLSTKEEVAVKTLHCRYLSPFEMELFRREVFIMSVLSFPTLVKFLGYTNEPPYSLITELMSNGSLNDFLRNKPEQLSPTNRTLIAIDIARGMEYLHSRSIIHRDLKSLNILLDDRKRAKICDFGLVRLKSKDPMTGLVGTSYWMAPEVLNSTPFYDEKVDVYSYGILLWELLTNRIPYDGDDSNKVSIQVLQQGRRPIIPPDTPPNLKTLIENCWSSNPEERPSFQIISSMLNDPTYQFPGSQGMVFVHDTQVNPRHMHSLSSPSVSHYHATRRNLSDHRTLVAGDSIARGVKRVGEAINQGHSEHFDMAINQLRSALRLSAADWKTVLPQYISIMENAPRRFMPKLLQVLFDILNDDTAPLHLKPKFIASLVLNDDASISSFVLSKLSSSSHLPLLNEHTIEALLSLATNPDQTVRSKAIHVLFEAIEDRTEIFIKRSDFLHQFMLFSSRKLPPQQQTFFVSSLQKLLPLMTEIPISSVPKILLVMQSFPKELLPKVASCVISVLSHEEIRINFSSSIWDTALSSPEEFYTIFTSFSKYPNDVTKSMIEKLASSSKSDISSLKALDILCSYPSIRSQLVTFLPINTSNMAILISIYQKLLFDKIAKGHIVNHYEFYECIRGFLRRPDIKEISSEIRLLEKLNKDYIERSGIILEISKAITESHDSISLMSLVFTFSLTGVCVDPVINPLFEIMKKNSFPMSPLSFVCLAALPKLSEEVSSEMAKFSIIYACTGTGNVQKTSITYLEKCQQNIAEIAANFLLESFKEKSEIVVSVANVLIKRLDDSKEKTMLMNQFQQ